MKANALKRVAGALSAAAVLVAGMALGTSTANALDAPTNEAYIQVNNLTEANASSSTLKLFRLGTYTNIAHTGANLTSVEVLTDADVQAALRAAIRAADSSAYEANIEGSDGKPKTYYTNPLAFIAANMQSTGFADTLRKIANDLGTGTNKVTSGTKYGSYAIQDDDWQTDKAVNLYANNAKLTKNGGFEFTAGVYLIVSDKQAGSPLEDVNVPMIVSSTIYQDAEMITTFDNQTLGQVDMKTKDGEDPDKPIDPVEPGKPSVTMQKKAETLWSTSTKSLVRYTVKSTIPSNWSQGDARHSMDIYDAPRNGVTVYTDLETAKTAIGNLGLTVEGTTIKHGNNEVGTAQALKLSVDGTDVTPLTVDYYRKADTAGGESTKLETPTDDDAIKAFVGAEPYTTGTTIINATMASGVTVNNAIRSNETYFHLHTDDVMGLNATATGGDVIELSYLAIVDLNNGGNDYGFKFDNKEATDGKDPEQQSKPIDYTVHNIDNNYARLAGGEVFKLYKTTYNKTSKQYEKGGQIGELSGSAVDATKGDVVFAGLGAGYYIVEQSTASTGYMQTNNVKYTIKISGSGTTAAGVLTVAVPTSAELTTAVGSANVSAFLNNPNGLFFVSSDGSHGLTTGHHYVMNVKNILQLPKTGGAGIALSVIVALVLGGFGLVSYRRSRKSAGSVIA
ncbi:collagen-binding protein [Bifidobacterium lemurum]|uniref:Collagen-binding protein n=1 Tax=Bifidobacterium lemurum TaxID=1603886 RepID=A0A261FQP7_9BIFI|nr:LPXTG cell wall anchor domain-containing protein [Bifidobacterium lemurum]OZG61477.1 collagen-binding protein [Bifidobacterium lemurum]QOL35100.1 LPXTG cell wall anchor domain-containing protein [Bifidobacterium lemurum]